MEKQLKEKRNEWVGGLILIGLGLFFLVNQFIDFNWDRVGVYFVPALGAIFLLAGILTRQAGLIIPGGIISGIGWGSVLVTGPFADRGDVEGGVFMLTFAAGWALITVLTAVFTEKAHWWPLIPGGIMAIIGAGILFGGVFMQGLTLLGQIWPVFLILLGLYVLYHGMRGHTAKS
ncbi:MAG: hypothetical protein H6669_16935 [Ardenticatenaceae bacterium]|nr:hypothetical protein [Ardenticatenaceae bacterium]